MNRLILIFTNPLIKLFLFVFFLIPLMLSGQEDKKMKFSTERYKSDWEKVSADETKGLPKSALENFTPFSSLTSYYERDESPLLLYALTLWGYKEIEL
jgi:hypothetical protein